MMYSPTPDSTTWYTGTHLLLEEGPYTTTPFQPIVKTLVIVRIMYQPPTKILLSYQHTLYSGDIDQQSFTKI